jgi:exopolysaccharide biosynthesis polyprenyl glycosylphosphotransferase
VAVHPFPAASTVRGRTLDRARLLRAVVPAADVCALAAAMAIAGVAPWSALYAGIVLLGVHLDPARAGRICPQLTTDAGWLLARGVTPLVVLLPAAAALGADPNWALLVPMTVGLLLLGRGSAYAIGRRARVEGVLAEPTLIVGAGEIADRLTEVLDQHPEYGLRLVGSVDDGGRRVGNLPLLGDPRDIGMLIEMHGVRRIVVAFGISERELVAVLRSAERSSAEVHIVPRLWEASAIAPGAGNVDDIWGVPLVQLRRPTTRSRNQVVKRCFDVLVASLLLLLTLPLLVTLAIAVRFSGPGPILFRQKRVGVDGTLFEILKFRSMHEIADADTRWTVGDDGVTRVGRVLRATSLDELPQLVNVLKGEMSLVGPRPERPHFVDSFAARVPRYEDRHRVRAGMTGLPQVCGLRGDTSIEDRIRFDNAYIDGWSLWADCSIVIRTAKCVLTGAGS